MSNENAEVNQVLETVTRTIRSLVDLVDAATGTIKDQDAKIRTLQSQVYALREDLTLVINGHNAHVDNFARHTHEEGNA